MAELRRVLLVEDDEMIAAGVTAVLEMEGIDVFCVALGREAEDTIVRYQPDAVVLDVGLPDISGIEVFETISARWPELPVMFSSGHADEANLAPYLKLRTVGFLSKPYAIETLLEELRRLASSQ